MTNKQRIIDEIRQSRADYVTYGDADLGTPVARLHAIRDLSRMDDNQFENGIEWYECDDNGNIFDTNCNGSIFYLTITDIIDLDDTMKMVVFDLSTRYGTIELSEYVNEDNLCERIDSNLRYNLIADIASVFNMELKPSLMPISDYLPLDEIYDTLDDKLEEDLKW